MVQNHHVHLTLLYWVWKSNLTLKKKKESLPDEFVAVLHLKKVFGIKNEADHYNCQDNEIPGPTWFVL